MKLELGNWVPDELVTMEMLRYACIICVDCVDFFVQQELCVCVCACVRACVRACVCARARVCVVYVHLCACVCVHGSV